MKIERTVAATFDTEMQSSYVFDELLQGGYPQRCISVLMSSNTGDKEFSVEPKTKVFEGMAAGSTLGAAIGSLVGGLSAIMTLPTGGLSLLAAGPLFASLAGMGIGSSVGGLSGGLIGLGFEEYKGELIEKGLGTGGILIAVTIDEDKVDEVKKIFENAGGKNISVARKLKTEKESPRKPLIDSREQYDDVGL